MCGGWVATCHMDRFQGASSSPLTLPAFPEFLAAPPIRCELLTRAIMKRMFQKEHFHYLQPANQATIAQVAIV